LITDYSLVTVNPANCMYVVDYLLMDVAMGQIPRSTERISS